MRRLLTLIAVVLTLVTGSFSPVSAQDDGTPAAGGSDSGTIFYGSDGQEEGIVSVAQIVDPFEDFDASFTPQRGFHFVMAVVTVEATADSAIEANAYGFYLVDTDGFQYYQTFTYRSADQTEALPDFTGGPMQPGDSLSGAVFFEVLDGTTPGLITYQPSYDRLVTAADLRDEPVAAGDPVEFLATNGQPAASITVDEVILPLEQTTSSAQRGSEFAGAIVTVENIGDGTFTLEPYYFSYVDAEGFVYYNYGVFRTEEAEAEVPTLRSTELAAGDSVTGMLSFEVFAGSEPSVIYYSPSSDRHVRVVEFGDAAGGLTGAEIEIPVSGGDDVTPEVTIESSPECEEVISWGEETIGNISAWAEEVGSVGPALTGSDLDPEVARDAADAIADIAEAQADLDAPELSEDASDLVIALFEDSVGPLNDLADALESGDDAEIAEAVAAISELGSEEYLGPLDDAINELTEACPALDSLG